jgi:ABC-2 type transport system permease protein
MTAGALAPYRAVLGARFRTMLQYRAAALAGLGTQTFFGIVRIMIFEAFYRQSTGADETQPMTLRAVIDYVWLGQALLVMLPWNVDADVRAMVRSGNVAYELVRPVDLYGLWYARAVAWRTAPAMLRAVPMVVFAMLVLPLVGMGEWRLSPPPSLAAGVAFFASLIGAVALSAAMTTILNVTLLWTISGEGVSILLAATVTVFSGLVLPLPLYPDWARTALMVMPFAGVMDLPFRLYTGDLPSAAVGWVLLHQTLWTAALVLLGRWLLRIGMRRVVVQGG